MCLTVTHVPTTLNSHLVMVGYKRLEQWTITSRFRTPYRNVLVPKNGWLKPEEPRGYYHEPIRGEQVNGGMIHLHCTQEYAKKASYSSERVLRCYAIDVRAFDHTKSTWSPDKADDAAAMALYIPEADVNSSVQEKIIIERLLKKHINYPDPLALVKALPFLKRLIIQRD